MCTRENAYSDPIAEPIEIRVKRKFIRVPKFVKKIQRFLNKHQGITTGVCLITGLSGIVSFFITLITLSIPMAILSLGIYCTMIGLICVQNLNFE